jgi:hypothetical protein
MMSLKNVLAELSPELKKGVHIGANTLVTYIIKNFDRLTGEKFTVQAFLDCSLVHDIGGFFKYGHSDFLNELHNQTSDMVVSLADFVATKRILTPIDFNDWYGEYNGNDGLEDLDAVMVYSLGFWIMVNKSEPDNDMYFMHIGNQSYSSENLAEMEIQLWDFHAKYELDMSKADLIEDLTERAEKYKLDAGVDASFNLATIAFDDSVKPKGFNLAKHLVVEMAELF